MLPHTAFQRCYNCTSNIDNDTELSNCDNGVHYTQSQYIIRVWLMVPTIIFGLSTHAVNIRIFAMSEMRKSLVNWFILCLCISDVSILVCSFLMFAMPALIELMTTTMSFYNFCAFAMRWTYPVATIAQTINIYLTIALSLHRYLGVCHPLRAQSLVDRKSVIISIVSVLLFCGVFNATRFIEMTLTRCWNVENDREGVMLAQTNFTHNMSYFVAYRVIAYTFFMFLVPFTLLIMINCLIIISLWESTGQRRIMTNYKKTSVAIFNNLRRSIRRRTTTSATTLQFTGNNNSTNNTIKAINELSVVQERSNNVSSDNSEVLTHFNKHNIITSDNLLSPKRHVLSTKKHRYQNGDRMEPHFNNNDRRKQRAQSCNRTVTVETDLIRSEPQSPREDECTRMHRFRSSFRRSLRTFQENVFERRITLMMVALICVFLLCNLLPCISNIADIVLHYQLHPDHNGRAVIHPRSAAFTLLVELGNYTVVLNSTTSFFIYYALGSKYRALLFGLFTNSPISRPASRSQSHLVPSRRAPGSRSKCKSTVRFHPNTSSKVLMLRNADSDIQYSIEVQVEQPTQN